MPQMTRTPMGNIASNYEASLGVTPVPIRYYEARYSNPGPQEWIIAPDAGTWAATVFFLNGPGSAWIEGTDMPPSELYGITSSSSSSSIPGSVTHTYPVTDIVSDTTRAIMQCCTAIRVNVVGGTVDLTVAC